MPHKRKLVKEEELIVEAYTVHDRTLRELACFHNVTPGTIRNILRRRGVTLRGRGRRKEKPNAERE
jgi:hypothetical protein